MVKQALRIYERSRPGAGWGGGGLWGEEGGGGEVLILYIFCWPRT